MFRILALLLLPVICLAQVNSNGEKPTGELLSNEISPNEIKRNASFNLDEIKVRWKKAALENCTGAPCASFSAPGPVTSIAATPTGPTSVRVSFEPPASTGGSPITGYEATATPTSSAPAKRKSSATITVKGDKSPIDIPGLATGQNYIFTVVALNAAGGSAPTGTVIPVAPCTLNTPAKLTNIPVLTVGVRFGIGLPTTGATGIGTATGLPDGMIAYWVGGYLYVEGTPTVAGTFDVVIPLTGGCGSVNATGTITVTDCKQVSVVNFPSQVIVKPNAPIPMSSFIIQTVNATELIPIIIPDGLIVSTLGSDGKISISGAPVFKQGSIFLELRVTGACGNPFLIFIDFIFD
jgi:hypothetical protein